METIKNLYREPTSPAGFSGFANLYNEARKKNSKITRDMVREFLEGDRTYNLFKQRKVNYVRSKTIPAGFMTDSQVNIER